VHYASLGAYLKLLIESLDILLLKLIDRNVPRCFIEIIRNWYDKMFCAVKWGLKISTFFPLTSGVRQGGILSPALFAIYVDDVLNKLE
jgi:hypothetical protein